jgi:hypothetical protein
MRRTPFGKFKLWIWDCWTAWMGFFDIYVGDLPKSWIPAMKLGGNNNKG